MTAWLLRHPTLLLLASLTFLLLGGGGLGLWWIVRPRRVAVPPTAGSPALDHGRFEALLERFVNARGEVDYAGWSRDPAALAELDAYLGVLAVLSPASHPERFPDEPARLAYWLYAYNACVIKGVLLHWPIRSVQDVQAPLELVAGLGFFGTLEFVLGGDPMTLHHLEQGLIRPRFPDPRVHFVLNCASRGCPVLRPELPTGAELEPFLADSARAFVNDPENVQVDHPARRLRVSAIFSWYREDFLAELARRGVPPGERSLLTYLVLVADPARREELERARDYALETLPYDWSLNATE